VHLESSELTTPEAEAVGGFPNEPSRTLPKSAARIPLLAS